MTTTNSNNLFHRIKAEIIFPVEFNLHSTIFRLATNKRTSKSDFPIVSLEIYASVLNINNRDFSSLSEEISFFPQKKMKLTVNMLYI